MTLRIIEAIVGQSSIRQEVTDYLSSFIGLEKILFFVIYGEAASPASYHLWYLPALIWAIIAVYIFIKIQKLQFLLLFSFLLNVIGLFGQTYSGVFNLEILGYSIKTRDALFFGLFYTTLGAYTAYHYTWIKQKVSQIKSSSLIFLFLIFSIISIIERIIANLYWSNEISAVDYYFSTIFVTSCLFLFVLKNGHIGEKSVLSNIGHNAVGIYVSHTFFIDITYFILDLLEKMCNNQ